MKRVQEEFGLSYLFIAHDLGVVKYMCDNLAIMNKGRFVEIGTREDIYNNPQHIYTRRLSCAIPKIDVDNRERQIRFNVKQLKQSTAKYIQSIMMKMAVYMI